MFYAISGINGDYEAYKRALKKLKFQNLDDIQEEDIMNEEAVISTLEGEDVLYVLGNIIGPMGGSMKILQDMMSRDNVIAIVGENEYRIAQSFKALDEHIRSTGDVPPQAVIDKITSMLGEDLAGAVREFVSLDDDEREDIIDYIDEISEEAFLEVVMAKKHFVLVSAGIKNFDPEKALDDYDTADFITEPADMDRTYYEDRILIAGRSCEEDHIVKKNNNVAIDCSCAGRLAIYCLNNDTVIYV